MKTVTLARGTKMERNVNLNELQIPDLWQIAEIKELQGYSLGGKSARELIIECWHLCHDLKKAIEAL